MGETAMEGLSDRGSIPLSSICFRVKYPTSKSAINPVKSGVVALFCYNNIELIISKYSVSDGFKPLEFGSSR